MSTKYTRNEEPDIIYHYTTINGLKGIIENKNIWATNINHLSDWQEFKEFVTPFLKRFQGTGLENAIEEIFSRNSRFIYVCSFSRKYDDLSQWRAYSPNANGFSVGFNYSKLKGMLPSGGLFKLYGCKYDNKSKEDEIKETIQNNKKTEDPDVHELHKIITTLSELAPCYKNDKFKDEEEWRLVVFIDKEKIKFREGKTMIIPYIEINLVDKDDNLPIDSICIGPTPYMAESELSLKILLEQNNMPNVKIIKSKVPYRML